MGPYFTVTDVLNKRGNLDTDMPTGRIQCEREHRDWGDASISHEMPKIVGKPSEARGDAGSRYSLPALRRNEACRHFDFGLAVSKTVREYILLPGLY